MPHPEYVIAECTDDFVYIIDIGHTYTRTVANDPEYVIHELYEQYTLGDRRVVYKDSEGEIHELVHHNGKFLEYRQGHDGITIPDLRNVIIKQLNMMDDHELVQVFHYICHERGSRCDRL
jgi:hypothetical protein